MMGVTFSYWILRQYRTIWQKDGCGSQTQLRGVAFIKLEIFTSEIVDNEHVRCAVKQETSKASSQRLVRGYG